MERRNKIAATFGAVALAGSIGLASPAHASPHTPPPPLTQRYIISLQGYGNQLDVESYPLTGPQAGVAYNPSGSYNGDWYFQLAESPNIYEIHPTFNVNICLTLSTTQAGVSRDENCSAAPNQLFYDINESNGYYTIWNQDLDVYLNDPHSGSGAQHVAGTIASCYPGYNGCTWLQSTSP